MRPVIRCIAHGAAYPCTSCVAAVDQEQAAERHRHRDIVEAAWPLLIALAMLALMAPLAT